MSQHRRELPGGGTVEVCIDTDDRVVENMLVSSVDIAVNAIRNVEEANIKS